MVRYDSVSSLFVSQKLLCWVCRWVNGFLFPYSSSELSWCGRGRRLFDLYSCCAHCCDDFSLWCCCDDSSCSCFVDVSIFASVDEFSVVKAQCSYSLRSCFCFYEVVYCWC